MNNFFHLQKQPIYQKREIRNKVALNSFLAGKFLTHDFGGAIEFISTTSEVKRNSTDVSDVN